MRRAVEPCPISRDRVEEQHDVGASLIRMGHHRNRIAEVVGPWSPPAGGHDADSRGLDGPYPHRGLIRRAGPHPDDDMAVGVLPPVVVHDSPKRDVLAHVEHRVGMVRERWSRRQRDSEPPLPRPATDGEREGQVQSSGPGILTWDRRSEAREDSSGPHVESRIPLPVQPRHLGAVRSLALGRGQIRYSLHLNLSALTGTLVLNILRDCFACRSATTARGYPYTPAGLRGVRIHALTTQ